MFDEFDKFLKISDSYEEPENKEYAPTENLQVCLHALLPLRLPDAVHSYCEASTSLAAKGAAHDLVLCKAMHH